MRLLCLVIVKYLKCFLFLNVYRLISKYSEYNRKLNIILIYDITVHTIFS